MHSRIAPATNFEMGKGARARRNTGHPAESYARGGARGWMVPAIFGLARAEMPGNTELQTIRLSSGSRIVFAGSSAAASVRSEEGLTGAWKSG